MNTSSYEEQVIKILQREGAKFQREKTFQDLKHNKYRYDFYLTYPCECIIEVDGEYHFKPIRGETALKQQKERDRRKNSYCLSHQIPLYRVPYWEMPKITTLGQIITQAHLVQSKWHSDMLTLPQT